MIKTNKYHNHNWINQNYHKQQFKIKNYILKLNQKLMKIKRINWNHRVLSPPYIQTRIHYRRTKKRFCS